MSEREIQREGRWTSHAYNAHTSSSIEDTTRVSRELVRGSEGKERQLRQRRALGRKGLLVNGNCCFALPRSWDSRKVRCRAQVGKSKTTVDASGCETG